MAFPFLTFLRMTPPSVVAAGLAPAPPPAVVGGGGGPSPLLCLPYGLGWVGVGLVRGRALVVSSHSAIISHHESIGCQSHTNKRTHPLLIGRSELAGRRV